MNDYSEIFKILTKHIEKQDIKKLIYKINDKLESLIISKRSIDWNNKELFTIDS